jgi:crossover junction endodeoxyribonuclease RuvC
MTTLLIGIDPGHTGAIAFYRPADHKLHVYDMPLRERKNGRHELDYSELARLVRLYVNNGLAFESSDSPLVQSIAIIEDVGARIYVDASGTKRGQGAAASFAFGKSAGAVMGILAAYFVPTIAVPPGVWKSLMGLGRDKNLSRTKAASLFVDKMDLFERKKDDGRAEAALLAYYGKRILP